MIETQLSDQPHNMNHVCGADIKCNNNLKKQLIIPIVLYQWACFVKPVIIVADIIY